jgi:hypothetical protein
MKETKNKFTIVKSVEFAVLVEEKTSSIVTHVDAVLTS